MLARFHLLGQEDEREEIETELQKKVDAMINRSLYTQYKMSDDPQEQEKPDRSTLTAGDISPAFGGDILLVGLSQRRGTPLYPANKEKGGA